MSHENGQQYLTKLFRTKKLDLPFSPELLQTLFAQTDDAANISLEDIAATIQRDQGLTTRMLALANSAYYGLQTEVSTVSRALMVLGLKEVRTMALALGVQALTRRQNLPREFDLREYWMHQLAVAGTVKTLADMSPSADEVDADQLFTAGLLHDLGKLLAALHAPDDWRAIVALAVDQRFSYIQAEDLHWGLDHGVVGALVLKSWHLPVGLTEPINWHHAPELAPEHQTAATLLSLADELTRRPSETAAARAVNLGLRIEDAQVAAANAMADESNAVFVSAILSSAGSGPEQRK